MATERILCAGFGGQGIMSLGKLIACASMLAGKEVTWMPSYGPEMRGGTAYCSVVVSDDPVGSPIVTANATSLVVMNLPSFDRFEGSVVPGGLLLVNRSLIHRETTRRDLEVHALDTQYLAQLCEAPESPNIIMLGAYLALRSTVSLEQIRGALKTVFSLRSSKQVGIHVRTVQCGKNAVTVPTVPRWAA